MARSRKGTRVLPLVAGVALLRTNRDAFGASLALWWFGQSMMDCAPYIGDARALQLPLLGGGTGADRPGACSPSRRLVSKMRT